MEWPQGDKSNNHKEQRKRIVRNSEEAQEDRHSK